MNIEEFKTALLREKKEIEDTLSSISTKNPNNPNDWEAAYPDFNIETADKSDLADEVEEYDKNLNVNSVLEGKLIEINEALERIQAGTYGKCDKGGELIGAERLRANPAARTCIRHSH